MSQLPHAGPGGVATTPSAAIFQGVDDHIIGTALVAGQTGSRLRTSDLRVTHDNVHMLAHTAM